MNLIPKQRHPAIAGPHESEIFPEVMSAANRVIEPGDALEAFHAIDDGVLAEVPHALDAYIRHQCFNLN